MLDGGGAGPSIAGRSPSVVHVLATRPDAVTLAPVYAPLDRGATFGQFIVHTGEHTGRSMVGKTAVLGLLEPHGPDGHSRVRAGTVKERQRKTLAFGSGQ